MRLKNKEMKEMSKGRYILNIIFSVFLMALFIALGVLFILVAGDLDGNIKMYIYYAVGALALLLVVGEIIKISILVSSRRKILGLEKKPSNESNKKEDRKRI